MTTPFFREIGNICHPKVIYGMTDARHIRKNRNVIRNINICPFQIYIYTCISRKVVLIRGYNLVSEQNAAEVGEINFIMSRSNVAMQTVAIQFVFQSDQLITRAGLLWISNDGNKSYRNDSEA